MAKGWLMAETVKPVDLPKCPAPDGFVYRFHLYATIETAAETFGVSTRTIYNWLERTDLPLPANYLEGDREPVINMGAMVLWMTIMRERNPDFGRHGGERYPIPTSQR